MTHKPNPDSPQESFESQIERAIRIINKGDLLNPITGGLSIARCDEVKQVLTRARERPRYNGSSPHPKLSGTVCPHPEIWLEQEMKEGGE